MYIKFYISFILFIAKNAKIKRIIVNITLNLNQIYHFGCHRISECICEYRFDEHFLKNISMADSTYTLLGEKQNTFKKAIDILI